MPYSLRTVCGFNNVPQLFATRVVRRDLQLIVLTRTLYSVSCNGALQPFYLSSEVLKQNLLSNSELSFIVTFFYSGFLFALLVEDFSTKVRNALDLSSSLIDDVETTQLAIVLYFIYFLTLWNVHGVGLTLSDIRLIR